MLNCKLIFPLTLLLLITACKPVTEEPLHRWQLSVEGAYAGDIASNANYAVVSSIHHGLSVWDLTKNQRIYNWAQEQNSSDNLVLSIDISDNASHVMTANRENFALWNITTGKSEGYWQVRESTIRDIAVSNGGDYLLIGKSNGTVVHVNVDTGRRLEFLGHNEKINTVDMLPNGRVAISGGNDFTAYVWDSKSGQVIYQFNHTSRVSKVALDPKGRYAFSADSMQGAYLWDLKTGKRISSLQGTKRQEVFSSISFSPDGKILVTGAASRKVSVWDIATGKRLSHWFVSPKDANRPTGAVVYGVAFGDNNNLLTISSSGYVESWPITK
ncbi:PQQ-binding-like beta-propeller repeat protein [Colwellia sp. E2M01]|uniref:WD40 repeat domain-containing protein n=1 Tax=Colwellia sp. E2M01 TaxID=2841561 RepID=UPI001C099E74|nr:PQQ-binding-like beta-propeller repeat protein [Colwellia sp. E2M01]MBU2869145.1 PQQ-binding-like beta-propeller repeat protein [Colwellia sp. E2M01]